MENLTLTPFLSLDINSLNNRDLHNLDKDKKNLQKLLQMALEVELFTIPLYMSGMYSIEGYHQINTGNNFYQGRQWPGAAPKFRADITKDPNQDAFNKVFKVFIEEMLHLQIAANLCNAYGNESEVNAKFTNNGIVNPDYSWSCYGDKKTVIPGIIDFTDLKADSIYKNTKVKLDSLNKEQIKLFLAIESTEHDLQNEIDDKNKYKYNHNIPFDFYLNNEKDLKIYLNRNNKEEIQLLFGSISGLYISIIMYLLIEYEDGRKLYKDAFQNDSIQRDHFNKFKNNDKISEYPKLRTNLSYLDVEEKTNLTKDNLEFEMILRMIDGILDQGEGEPLYVLIYNIIKHIKKQSGDNKKPSIKNLLSIKFDNDNNNAIQKYYLEVNDETIKTEIESIATWLKIKLPQTLYMAVSPENQSDDEALTINHPSYDDKGNRTYSSSHAARGGANAKMDHHQIFAAVEKLLKAGKVTTWDIVHSKSEAEKNKRHINKEDLHKNCPKDEKGNYLFWCKDYLITNPADYKENRENYPQLPTAEEIAAAMNEVTNNKEKYKTLLSQATTGTLKGLLNGMEEYWAKENGQFPGPAMGGSGDRMSICWALLGNTPDLNICPDQKQNKDPKTKIDFEGDYHSCQGLFMPVKSIDELNQDNHWVKNGKFGCASPAVYHSCKGSNTCSSEGGCGFVQTHGGISSCGSSNPQATPSTKCGSPKIEGKCHTPPTKCGTPRIEGKHPKCGTPKIEGMCGTPPRTCGNPKIKHDLIDLYTVPGSHNCATQGGCAVPISALQMFPEKNNSSYLMMFELDNEVNSPSYKKTKKQVIKYNVGDLVYDVAWEVYSLRLKNKFPKENMPEKPKTNVLRLIFPPST